MTPLCGVNWLSWKLLFFYNEYLVNQCAQDVNDQNIPPTEFSIYNKQE